MHRPQGRLRVGGRKQSRAFERHRLHIHRAEVTNNGLCRAQHKPGTKPRLAVGPSQELQRRVFESSVAQVPVHHGEHPECRLIRLVEDIRMVPQLLPGLYCAVRRQ